MGIKESANVNTALVVLKVAGAGGVRRRGLRLRATATTLRPSFPPNTGEFGEFGWSGVLRGAAVIFFAYIGFDAVSTAAQEAKNPQRDLPIGILGSLAICTVLYIAVAIVLTGIVPYTQLERGRPAGRRDRRHRAHLAEPRRQGRARCSACFSTMLVQLLGQTRIFFSMSRDGLLPPLFGSSIRVSARRTCRTILVGRRRRDRRRTAAHLHLLSQLVSMGTLLAFVLACVGIIVLRHTAPNAPRPFKTPWMPWTPILGALTCLAQMIGLPWATWERLILWLVIGVIVYWSYGRKRSVLRRAQGA